MSETAGQEAAFQNMKKQSIKTIPHGSFFSEPVYLEKQFILTAPEMPFSEKMMQSLEKWEFKEVFCSGDPMEDYAAEKVEEMDGNVLIEPSTVVDTDQIIRAENFYSSFLKYVEGLYNQATVGNKLDYNPIAERVKSVCEVIREEGRFLMRVQRTEIPSPTGNYLAAHATRSTIIALIIGNFLKLPTYRLIELGVSSLLHEIGMIKFPPQVYLSKRPLQPQERKAILAHPTLGYNILKEFDFPLPVTLGALEHHERENSSGYPRKLSGDRISLYAKIIAVACSYEAISSHRPHKEAKDGYTGMLELLKNEGKQYDDTVVRALVFSLSIYPIGLYVLLSSGRKGQVVDANPENPRYPIVQVFGELTPDGKNKIIGTSQDGISIVRPLTREEINPE